MEEIRGQSKHTSLFFHRETKTLFMKKIRRGEKLYLRCRSKECGASAVMVGDTATIINAEHQHREDHYKIYKKCMLKAELESRIASSVDEIPSEVFSSVIGKKRYRKIAVEVRYRKVKSSMKRWVKETLPTIPKTPQQLAEMLEHGPANARQFSLTKDKEPFYMGCLEGPSWTTLVFISSPIMKKIGRGTFHLKAAFDGTFKTVPKMFYQMLTMHVCMENGVYCFGYALMTSKKTGAYHQLFEYLKMLYPDLNLKEATSDYEGGLRKALRVAFGAALIIWACWFHFCQSLQKKANNAALIELRSEKDEASQLIRMCMALPLLPSEQAEDGLVAIEGFQEEAELTEECVEIFLNYVRTYWMEKVTPQTFSVFNAQRRTNNDVEGFNSRFNRRTKTAHCNVWRFMKKLRDTEMDERNDFLHEYSSGSNPRQERKLSYVNNDRSIKRAQRKLRNEAITPLSFLKQMSYAPYHILPNIAEDIEEESDSDYSEYDSEEDEEDNITSHVGSEDNNLNGSPNNSNNWSFSSSDDIPLQDLFDHGHDFLTSTPETSFASEDNIPLHQLLIANANQGVNEADAPEDNVDEDDVPLHLLGNQGLWTNQQPENELNADAHENGYAGDDDPDFHLLDEDDLIEQQLEMNDVVLTVPHVAIEDTPNAAERLPGTCVVCLTNRATLVQVPCYHICICPAEGCKVANNFLCPICWQEIHQYIAPITV